MEQSDNRLLSELKELNYLRVDPQRREEIYNGVVARIIQSRKIHRMNGIAIICASLICVCFAMVFRGPLYNKIFSVVTHVTEPLHIRMAQKGQFVTQYVDTPVQPVSSEDLSSAIRVVKEINQAANRRDGRTYLSLMYNTFVVPMSKDRLKTFLKASKQWQDQTYAIGKPYVVQNWSSNYYNFLANTDIVVKNPQLKGLSLHLADKPSDFLQKAYQYRYHVVFKAAIAVPVTINQKENMVLYCVEDDQGQWKVAYSWANGYDRGYHQ